MIKTVTLQERAARKLAIFNEATGTKASDVVNEALHSWLDTVGEARLEQLAIDSLEYVETT